MTHLRFDIKRRARYTTQIVTARDILDEFADRHRRIRERMAAEELDAVIAYSNAKVQGCVQYVANYAVRFVAANTLPNGEYTMAGSCAALFPADGDDTVLAVDQRWDEFRAKETSVLAETHFAESIGAEFGRLVAERGYRRVGIDNWFIFPAIHYLALRELAPAVEFVGTQLIEHTYKVKTEAELALVRKAEEVGVRALEAAFEAVEVGASEFDIALAADYAMRKFGDLEVAGGLVAAAGKNTAIASGIPRASDAYVMQRGDWIMLDICPRYQGYAGDICRMFVAGDVGDVDEFRRGLYDATVTIVEEVVKAVKPGVVPRALNELAQSVADDLGVGQYKTTTLGHGLGIDLHDVPDFRWDPWPLEPGTCITIEPCLIVPGVTGTRVEELVAVTETGCDVLSAGAPTELLGST
jgi:Xaa-Pro aminopeptidase